MPDIDQQLLTCCAMTVGAAFRIWQPSRAFRARRVRARIEHMERSGDIVGYTVIRRADAISMPVCGIMLVVVEGRAADRVVDVLGAAEHPT